MNQATALCHDNRRIQEVRLRVRHRIHHRLEVSACVIAPQVATPFIEVAPLESPVHELFVDALQALHVEGGAPTSLNRATGHCGHDPRAASGPQRNYAHPCWTSRFGGGPDGPTKSQFRLKLLFGTELGLVGQGLLLHEFRRERAWPARAPHLPGQIVGGLNLILKELLPVDLPLPSPRCHRGHPMLCNATGRKRLRASSPSHPASQGAP
mmetsp:Transcript_47451/g.144419  ORF Transcript_47451/g.144419 Transcript_47451/m.144419 type:complete len:210 (+) Transcript_47451:1276-1905(+)